MINKIYRVGSIATTLHDFKITTEGMNLMIDASHYTRNGVELFKNYIPETIKVLQTMWDREQEKDVEVEVERLTGKRIQQPGVTILIESPGDYIVWLTTVGIEVVHKATDENFGSIEGKVIEKLAWFTVPKLTKSLADVEINVIEIKEG